MIERTFRMESPFSGDGNVGAKFAVQNAFSHKNCLRKRYSENV